MTIEDPTGSPWHIIRWTHDTGPGVPLMIGAGSESKSTTAAMDIAGMWSVCPAWIARTVEPVGVRVEQISCRSTR